MVLPLSKGDPTVDDVLDMKYQLIIVELPPLMPVVPAIVEGYDMLSMVLFILSLPLVESENSLPVGLKKLSSFR
jgi:hypothetical protein